MPADASGWLIGAGALLGALAMLLPWTAPLTVAGQAAPRYTSTWGLASGTNVVFLALLLLAAATVFFVRALPPVRGRPLVILACMLVGLGIAVDRLGIGSIGIGLIVFFLAMVAGTVGALMALQRPSPNAVQPGGADDPARPPRAAG